MSIIGSSSSVKCLLHNLWPVISLLFIIYIFISLPTPKLEAHRHGDFVALILARGGSKGIKLKNLAKVGNQTLLANAINVALESKIFRNVWVSTDNELTEKEAKQNGAKIHLRAEYTATDDASSLTAVQEFITFHPEIGTVALIQCTSPFLSKEKLLKAATMMLSGSYNSVFSVTRQFKLRWKENMFGELEADNFDPEDRPRRQDWSGELVENGMFYFFKSRDVIKYHLLQKPKVGVVEIPTEESLEIDSPKDLMFAEAIKQNFV